MEFDFQILEKALMQMKQPMMAVDFDDTEDELIKLVLSYKIVFSNLETIEKHSPRLQFLLEKKYQCIDQTIINSFRAKLQHTLVKRDWDTVDYDVPKFQQCCLDFIIQMLLKDKAKVLVTTPLSTDELKNLNNLRPGLQLMLETDVFAKNTYMVRLTTFIKVILALTSDKYLAEVSTLLKDFKKISGFDEVQSVKIIKKVEDLLENDKRAQFKSPITRPDTEDINRTWGAPQYQQKQPLYGTVYQPKEQRGARDDDLQGSHPYALESQPQLPQRRDDLSSMSYETTRPGKVRNIADMEAMDPNQTLMSINIQEDTKTKAARMCRLVKDDCPPVLGIDFDVEEDELIKLVLCHQVAFASEKQIQLNSKRLSYLLGKSYPQISLKLTRRLKEKIDECSENDEYDVPKFQAACLKFITKLLEDNAMILVTSPLSAEQISGLADEKKGVDILLQCDTISRRVYLVKLQIFADMIIGRDDEKVRVKNFEWREIEDYDPVENEALDKKARKLLRASSKLLAKYDPRKSMNSESSERQDRQEKPKQRTKDQKKDSSEEEEETRKIEQTKKKPKYVESSGESEEKEEEKPMKKMDSIESTYHKDLAEKLVSTIVKEQCEVEFGVLEDELVKSIVQYRIYFKNSEKIKQNYKRIMYLLDQNYSRIDKADRKVLKQAIMDAANEDDGFDARKVKIACAEFLTVLLKKNEAVVLITTPFTVNQLKNMKDITPAIQLMMAAKHVMAHTYKVKVQTFSGLVLNEYIIENLKDWIEVKGFTPVEDEEVDDEVFRIMALNKGMEPGGVLQKSMKTVKEAAQYEEPERAVFQPRPEPVHDQPQQFENANVRYEAQPPAERPKYEPEQPKLEFQPYQSFKKGAEPEQPRSGRRTLPEPPVYEEVQERQLSRTMMPPPPKYEEPAYEPARYEQVYSSMKQKPYERPEPMYEQNYEKQYEPQPVSLTMKIKQQAKADDYAKPVEDIVKTRQLTAEMERQTAVRSEAAAREAVARARETKVALQKTVNSCLEKIESCSEAITTIEDMRLKRQQLLERKMRLLQTQIKQIKEVALRGDAEAQVTKLKYQNQQLQQLLRYKLKFLCRAVQKQQKKIQTKVQVVRTKLQQRDELRNRIGAVIRSLQGAKQNAQSNAARAQTLRGQREELYKRMLAAKKELQRKK